ncbi:MAG: trypsin-like peptidase domain-containing protein [Sciscionella sp.]|nr:trypsin-like peptidase domain-containing protein [Sciscionella sp.]
MAGGSDDSAWAEGSPRWPGAGAPAEPGQGSAESGLPSAAESQRVLFGSAAPGYQPPTAGDSSTGSFASVGSFGSPPGAGQYGTQQLPAGTLYLEGGRGNTVGNAGNDRRTMRSGGLLVAIAVLALIIGGGAGAAGGYFVAQKTASTASTDNALEAPPPAAQPTNAPSGSTEAVAQQLLPTVVELEFKTASEEGEGSGIVFSSDGLILTNNHVVAEAAHGGQIQAMFHDGKIVPVHIVGRDPTTDLAVVKADGVSGLPTARFGRSDDLKVGQQVIAIGSPYQLSGTVTSGIISALHRPTRAGGENGDQTTVMDAIQTDAAINPGNSGGPLVDMSGQIVGINSAIYNTNQDSGSGSQAGNVGIGFAIPVDQAKRIGDQLAKTGKATQTVLGVQVRDATPSGALIASVTSNGPADKGGVKTGDVVVKADDRMIDSSDALVALVHADAPNQKITLTMSSGKSVQVTLGGQPVPVN